MRKTKSKYPERKTKVKLNTLVSYTDLIGHALKHRNVVEDGVFIKGPYIELSVGAVLKAMQDSAFDFPAAMVRFIYVLYVSAGKRAKEVRDYASFAPMHPTKADIDWLAKKFEFNKKMLSAKWDT